MNTTRSRWAAIGAAVAVTLGAGGIGITHATTDSSDRPVSAFFPIEPCRLAENVSIGDDSSITLDGWGVTGNCELPSDTTGLAVNVTAVGATEQTNLRLYATGADLPETANLNPTPGAPATPNAANITLDATTGQFDVYNRFGTVNVFIDVMGYYDDHTHDDRYYTKEEIDQQPGVRVEWVNVGVTGSVRSHSRGLEGVSVVRPTGEPTGHYCVVVPSTAGLSGEAAVGTVQQSNINEVGRMIAVTTTFANSCFVAGVNAFVAVEIYDNTNAKVDNGFIVFIPRSEPFINGDNDDD